MKNDLKNSIIYFFVLFVILNSCKEEKVCPIINNPPIIVDQEFSINENSPKNTIVGTVLATDIDVGDTLTFSILSGDGNEAFIIESLTGLIRVNDSTQLDYELSTKFELVIKVIDEFGLNSLANITIHIINIDDKVEPTFDNPPKINDQEFFIIENSPKNTIVDTVIAMDIDFADTLTFSILAGDFNNAFHIDSLTGVISVNDSTQIDYEVNAKFELVIKVIDKYGLNSFARITIHVIDIDDIIELTFDNPPVISDQEFSINENSPKNTIVGTVLATDIDLEDILTFSILSGDINDAFIIEPLTGVISINDPTQIDYELNAKFELVIKVIDRHGLISVAKITINIIDVNEIPVKRTIVFQPDSTQSVDTYVNSSTRYLDRNFSKSNVIRANSWTDYEHNSPESNSRILMKFSELNDLVVSEIISANLVLYSVEDFPHDNGGQFGENDAVILRITEAWDVKTVTWNTQPLYSDAAPILIPQNNDFDSIRVEITSLVKEMIIENNGFMIKQSDEIPYRSMVFSSSSALDENKRPKLIIEYFE